MGALQVDTSTPQPLRWELFNVTMWAAESFEEAQPLISTALLNTVTKPPLHEFGTALSPQDSMSDTAIPGFSPSTDEHGTDQKWHAPGWLLPLVVCLSVGAPHTASCCLLYTSPSPRD